MTSFFPSMRVDNHLHLTLPSDLGSQSTRLLESLRTHCQRHNSRSHASTGFYAHVQEVSSIWRGVHSSILAIKSNICTWNTYPTIDETLPHRSRVTLEPCKLVIPCNVYIESGPDASWRNLVCGSKLIGHLSPQWQTLLLHITVQLEMSSSSSFRRMESHRWWKLSYCWGHASSRFNSQQGEVYCLNMGSFSLSIYLVTKFYCR